MFKTRQPFYPFTFVMQVAYILYLLICLTSLRNKSLKVFILFNIASQNVSPTLRKERAGWEVSNLIRLLGHAVTLFFTSVINIYQVIFAVAKKKTQLKMRF